MSCQAGPNVIEDGLVLALDAGNTKSYPGSGTSWSDLSGNGNDATLTNGPTYDSLGGGCFDFDGSNDFAEVSDNSTLDMETAWSIETWCRREGSPGGATFAKIISKWENYFLALDFSNGANIYGCVGTGTGHTCLGNGTERDNELPLNAWAHLMITYSESSGVARIYYNGTQIESWNASATASSNSPLSIGCRSQSGVQDQYFNGKISVARVYNKALTASEVTQNYNALKGRFSL